LRCPIFYCITPIASWQNSKLKGYYGQINDLSVALYRGAYTLDSIYINKLDEKSDKQLRFFKSDEVDLSIEWKSLFKGSLVGEIVLTEPLLQFTENRVELEDVARDTSDFRELLDDFMPIHINRCEIRNGHLIYADYTADPNIELEATQLVLQWKGQDKKDPFFKKVWEGIAGLGGKIVENPKKDQIATKIPLEGYLGTAEGIQTNLAVAVKNILRNAFFEALKPNFDYEISIKSALGWGSKDDDKKDDKGKRFRLFKKHDKDKNKNK
jgi:hypothetical protein